MLAPVIPQLQLPSSARTSAAAPAAGTDTRELLPTTSAGGDGAIWSWDGCCARRWGVLGSSLTLLFHRCLLRSGAATLGKEKKK